MSELREGYDVDTQDELRRLRAALDDVVQTMRNIEDNHRVSVDNLGASPAVRSYSTGALVTVELVQNALLRHGYDC